MKNILYSCVGALLLFSSVALAEQPPKNRISQDKAQATALKKFPGTVKSAELEKEKGRWIYSFDIEGTDKRIHEVWVDAKKGKIVGSKIESAGEEAAEAQSGEEHKEAAPQ